MTSSQGRAAMHARIKIMEEFSVPNTVGHAVAGSIVFSTILGWLPAVVSLVALIFYMIQIWESDTCRSWRAGLRHWHNNRVMVRRVRKLARLRAKERLIVAQMDAKEVTRTAGVEAKEILKIASSEAVKDIARAETKAAEIVPPPSA